VYRDEQHYFVHNELNTEPWVDDTTHMYIKLILLPGPVEAHFCGVMEYGVLPPSPSKAHF